MSLDHTHTHTHKLCLNVYGLETDQQVNIEKPKWGFPSGAVVKNPPASTGDTGSCPGPGRSHMLQSN